MFQVCLKLLMKHFYPGLKSVNSNMLSWCWRLFFSLQFELFLALGIILMESWTFFAL